MNQVCLVGNLGTDPEYKELSTGMTVCNFSMATSKKYKNKAGEMVDDTQWHKIVVWGKQGDNCAKYLSKGRKAGITGEIRYEMYEKDGEKKYVTKIVANNVEFLSSRGEATTSTAPVDEPALTEQNDDIPF